jgi:hypothetical protein
MTPKEKARELVDKFNNYSRIYPSLTYGIDGEFNLVNDSNKCALIAVEEILSWNQTKFWEDVKQEIENL